jgi:hypothetical protein
MGADARNIATSPFKCSGDCILVNSARGCHGDRRVRICAVSFVNELNNTTVPAEPNHAAMAALQKLKPSLIGKATFVFRRVERRNERLVAGTFKSNPVGVQKILRNVLQPGVCAGGLGRD